MDAYQNGRNHTVTLHLHQSIDFTSKRILCCYDKFHSVVIRGGQSTDQLVQLIKTGFINNGK